MLSFLIISGGKRRAAIDRLIGSIRAQGIDTPHLIFVVGRHPGPLPKDVTLIPAEREADTAAVCRMRNLGIDATGGDPVILLDDDMELAPGWWHAMATRRGIAGVIGCRVLTPAGDRWYDWAIASRTDPHAPPV